MRRAAVVAVALVLAACTSEGSDPVSTTTPTTTPAPSSTTEPAPATTMPPETTTSTASTPEPVAPEDIDGTVGFVGCSMSQNSVEGYESVGGTNMWSHRAPYGGGGIGRWFIDIGGDRGRYWEGFDAELAQNPDTAAVWLNVCTVRQNAQDSFDSAAAVIDEISDRIPGVTIYVSAQPTYADGHFCGLAGEGGPEAMAALVTEIVDAGLALPGPVMGPLTEAQTRDGCHANEDGQLVLGRQLLDFFG